MQIYCTGANRIWVQFPIVASAPDDPNDPMFDTPVPFCTCERAPRIRRIRGWENILSDAGGSAISSDLVYLGQEIMISGVANRFNWRVLDRLRKVPDYFAPLFGAFGDNDPGSDNVDDVAGGVADLGTMLVAENLLLTVFVEFPYANDPLLLPTKTVFSSGAMPRGYRLPGAIWLGPDEDSGGTGAFKTQFVILGKRVQHPTTGVWRAYDYDMRDIAGLVWEQDPA